MVTAIIQARMQSERLPNKISALINGKPMLQHVYDSAVQAKMVDKVVIATVEDMDGEMASLCGYIGTEYYFGSENDVLSRYIDCINYLKLSDDDVVVRLTGDCPMLPPDVIDMVVSQYKSYNVDYAANVFYPEARTFPRGYDVEVMSVKVLRLSNKYALAPFFREHISQFIWYGHGEMDISVRIVQTSPNYSHLRLTVDTQEDLDAVRAIYASYNVDELPWTNLLPLVDKNKDLRWLDQDKQKDSNELIEPTEEK